MRHIRPNVSTVCVGLAASMGAFLLASGHKGKRYSLPNSRIMIHQPLGGAQGQAADIEIQANEILHHKLTLNGYLVRTDKRQKPLPPSPPFLPSLVQTVRALQMSFRMGETISNTGPLGSQGAAWLSVGRGGSLLLFYVRFSLLLLLGEGGMICRGLVTATRLLGKISVVVAAL